MGELVAYPPVSPDKFFEIYKQSRREPIHGYGYFIELMSAYDKEYPLDSPDPTIHENKNSFRWMHSLKTRLVAAGIDRSYIVDYPTLPRYRVGKYCEEGWLVILGTGFDKKLHAPLADGLVKRVKEIIGTNKEPGWFTMRRFSYANPRAFNPYVTQSASLEQKEESIAQQ